MRSIRLDLADPNSPPSLVDVDEPDLPRGDWARVEELRDAVGVALARDRGTIKVLFRPTG